MRLKEATKKVPLAWYGPASHEKRTTITRQFHNRGECVNKSQQPWGWGVEEKKGVAEVRWCGVVGTWRWLASLASCCRADRVSMSPRDEYRPSYICCDGIMDAVSYSLPIPFQAATRSLPLVVVGAPEGSSMCSSSTWYTANKWT